MDEEAVVTDEVTDEAFYAVRLGRLLDIIGTSASMVAPLRLLDAGCGKGRFTRAMTRFGHAVDGIDPSEKAIEECRAKAVGRDRYAVGGLDEWAPPYLYDAVFALEAPTGLTEGDTWRRSVTNLGSLVRLGGLLCLADHAAQQEHVDPGSGGASGRPGYDSLLLPLGFRSEGFVSYRFRESPAGLHVFRRIA